MDAVNQTASATGKNLAHLIEIEDDISGLPNATEGFFVLLPAVPGDGWSTGG
jgi:hypothetical protein